MVNESSAIIMACGLGTRLAPITPSTPKPLVPIHGVPNLINTIRLLTESDISEIIVVLPGDHSSLSKFESTFTKFISTKIFDSGEDDFYYSNHHSVVKIAYNYAPKTYSNAYTLGAGLSAITTDKVFIIESDIYIDPELGRHIFLYRSSQSKFFTMQRSDEWRLVTDALGKIISVSTHDSGECMSGVSYWTGANLNKLRSLVLSIDKVNTDYWEDLFKDNINEFSVYIANAGRYAKEYDNISELLNNKLMTYDEIAALINEPNFEDLPKRVPSMTNVNYLIKYHDNLSVLRLPGIGTDEMVTRSTHEVIISDIASNHDLSPKNLWFDNHRVKISEFIPSRSFRSTDIYNPQISRNLFRALDTLHTIDITPDNRANLLDDGINLIREIEMYKDIINSCKDTLISNEDLESFSVIEEFIKSESFDSQLLGECHRDLIPSNILVTDTNEIKLIDYEYSGKLNIMWDYGNLLSELVLEDPSISESSYLGWIITYANVFNPEYILKWSYVVDYVWALWGYAKSALGDDNLSYANQRLNRARQFMTNLS